MIRWSAMAKRRRILGKKLLAVSASIGAAALLGCGDDDRSLDSGLVANLVLPADANMGPMDADTGSMDATTDADDSVGEAGTDASADDGGEEQDANL